MPADLPPHSRAQHRMDLPQMPSGPRAAHPSMPLPLPAAGADLQLRLRDVTPDRFCPTCQRWKQPNYFGRRGTGRTRDCKACGSARVIRDRQLRAARTIAQSATFGPAFQAWTSTAFTQAREGQNHVAPQQIKLSFELGLESRNATRWSQSRGRKKAQPRNQKNSGSGQSCPTG